jgi:nitrogenase-associated protein
MTTIQFYEKPGCINNTKQKAILKEQGYIVETHSLLTQEWTATSLRKFFNEMPVQDWFNLSNPQIKNGEIDPHTFAEDEALDAMISNPLFIRRPLLEVDGEYACGFDNALVKKLLGETDTSHVQSCPNHNNKC